MGESILFMCFWKRLSAEENFKVLERNVKGMRPGVQVDEKK